MGKTKILHPIKTVPVELFYDAEILKEINDKSSDYFNGCSIDMMARDILLKDIKCEIQCDWEWKEVEYKLCVTTQDIPNTKTQDWMSMRISITEREWL